MTDCIFCKIAAGTIPAKKLYEDGVFFIIADIDPHAAVHLLAIPKKHYPLLSSPDADFKDLSHMLSVIPTLCDGLGLAGGYRLIINQGENGGQSVPHLHIHIMGGQKLGWERH